MAINTSEILKKAEIKTMKSDIWQLKMAGVIRKKDKEIKLSPVQEKVAINTSPIESKKEEHIEISPIYKEHLAEMKKLLEKDKENEKLQKELEVKTKEPQKNFDKPEFSQTYSAPTTLGIFKRPEKKLPQETEKKVEPHLQTEDKIQDQPKIIHPELINQSPVLEVKINKNRGFDDSIEIEKNPLDKKEKSAESFIRLDETKIENPKKKKFMEEVEEWINSSSKNT